MAQQKKRREKKRILKIKKKLSILIFIDIDPKTGKIFLFACYFLIQGIKDKKIWMNREREREKPQILNKLL